MKAEPITVPYLEYHAKRAHTAARMASRGDRGMNGRMFANHEASLFERPAIRGIAVGYGELFMRDGMLTAFVAGCFTESLANGHSVDLRLEHEDANVLGSSASGLRFVDGPDGLAFEYEPPKGQIGAIAISLVASQNRTDVSVGARKLETTVRNIEGHDVRLITKARIEEISLAKDGSVKTSHARVVDLADALSLEEEVASGVLRMTGLTNELVTASKRLLATDDAQSAPVVPRAYPVHHIW